MTLRDLLPEISLPAEAAQRADEGYDVGDLRRRIADAIARGTLAEQAERFWQEFEALPHLSAPDEPDDLVAIQAARPSGLRRFRLDLDPLGLADRVYGAWLGRCAGCTLGKPVEGWPRARIAAYLHAADAYPLASYIPVLEPFPSGLALGRTYPLTTLGRIERMVRDDDLDYTLIGLRVLEQYGLAFTTAGVAATWLDNLPFNKVYTAEAVAYSNLVHGLEPPVTARYRNPYREWIGAQIRADMWGYANPGHPAAAAAMAYRDAALSHTRNGIYGAMWAAACIAAAFATADPQEIIAAGLAEIPARCRLARAIAATVGWYDQGDTWEEAADRVAASFGNYDPVHVINNTCLVVLALLYGRCDLGPTICYAVMGGWDTDCTGATAGSIIGAARGASGLSAAWVGPLNDHLESVVPGCSDCRISDLAQRTVAAGKLVERNG